MVTRSCGPGGDYYRDLGVSAAAEFGEVRRAYLRRARALHPDRNHSPTAAEEFARVATAYRVLSDPTRRATYDARYDAAHPENGSAAASTHPESDSGTEPAHPAGGSVGADYVPAGEPRGYGDYMPTAPSPTEPPRPPGAEQPPRTGPAPSPVRDRAGRAWPPGWPVGRIDPHRGLGPVLLLAFRWTPLPRARLVTVGAVLVGVWLLVPFLTALLPSPAGLGVDALVSLLLWGAVLCWLIRGATHTALAAADTARRAAARARHTARRWRHPGGQPR